MTGIILSGGCGKRMGAPKHLMKLGSETLLERAVRRISPYVGKTLVVGARAITTLNARHVDDIFQGIGPLGGIHAALSAARDDCAIVACDMPFFSPGLLLYMATVAPEADAVVPYVNGFWEPLHAVYRPSCLVQINRIVRACVEWERQPRVADLYPHIKVQAISAHEIREFGLPDQLFFNINSPADYHSALRVLAEGNLQ